MGKKDMKDLGLEGVEDLDELEEKNMEGFNDAGLVPPDNAGTFQKPILIPSRKQNRVVVIPTLSAMLRIGSLLRIMMLIITSRTWACFSNYYMFLMKRLMRTIRKPFVFSRNESSLFFRGFNYSYRKFVI